MHGQGSDMQAMNAALSGPHGWTLQHGSGQQHHQMLDAIARLADAKRHEAERVRRIANQCEAARDPQTDQAQEAALVAEAEASGVLAVERAVEHALDGQALHQIASIVAIYEEERHHQQAAWNEAQGMLGDHDHKTIAARLAMLQAHAAWQGAAEAQAAPAQSNYEAAEHPQAIANRALAAEEAYRADAKEMKREADMDAKKYGKKDPRTVDAQRSAAEAERRAASAHEEAETAQALADGGPTLEKKLAGKKGKKKRAGIC